MLTFTYIRRKDLEKIEFQNTEFYFDFRFSIFGHFAFLCSNLYYSKRARSEYHVRSECSHFCPSTEEKTWKNLNIEIQNFNSIFDIQTLGILCSNLHYSKCAHCKYHVRSEGTHFYPSTKEKIEQNLNNEIQNLF